MDTELLLKEAKARFSHNSAKKYLNEKYNNKLIVADQNGLWRADQQTISFLNSVVTDEVILLDTFNNLVKVNRLKLLEKLLEVYTTVTNQWYEEFNLLENKR